MTSPIDLQPLLFAAPKGYERIGEIPFHDFLPQIGTAEDGVILGKNVGLSSKRLLTIAKNSCCEECKVVAKIAAVERNNYRPADKGQKRVRPNTGWHVNIYGIKNGQQVMLTRDHIIPQSLNGADTPENSQTLCSQCNNRKASKIYLPNYGLLMEHEMKRMHSKAPLYEKNQIKAAIVKIKEFFRENVEYIKQPPVVNIGTAVILIMNDKPEYLFALLAERPDTIHAKTNNGQSLLHFSAAKGNTDALNQLESLGVVWENDKGGLNPWQFAVVNHISSRFVKLSTMLDWCVDRKYMSEEDKAQVVEFFSAPLKSRATKTHATIF